MHWFLFKITFSLDFKTTPNLKKLTYLDVMSRFNVDSSVFMDIKLPQ